MIALGFLVFAALTAIFASVIAPQDPNATSLREILNPPSGAHWLGTDDVGRDVLSRLIFASRASLLASVQAVTIAVVVGVTIGVISGYLGGWVDVVLMRVTDALLSVPGLLMAMAVIGILGPGLTNAMVGLAIVFSPSFMRLARGQVLAVKEEPFMEAARSVGVSDVKIIFRHVLPNIASPIVVQILMTMGFALLAEGALSYLGLSIQPPTPSWGSMLQRAFAFNNKAPWLIFIPGLAIMLTIWAFNVLGDGLRDALSSRDVG